MTTNSGSPRPKTRAERRREQRLLRKGILPAGPEERAPERAAPPDLDDWDNPLMLRSKTYQVARKEYACECAGDRGHCVAVIQPGERYCRIAAIDQDAVGPRSKRGKYATFTLCMKCGPEKMTKIE